MHNKKLLSDEDFEKLWKFCKEDEQYIRHCTSVDLEGQRLWNEIPRTGNYWLDLE